MTVVIATHTQTVVNYLFYTHIRNMLSKNLQANANFDLGNPYVPKISAILMDMTNEKSQLLEKISKRDATIEQQKVLIAMLLKNEVNYQKSQYDYQMDLDAMLKKVCSCTRPYES